MKALQIASLCLFLVLIGCSGDRLVQFPLPKVIDTKCPSASLKPAPNTVNVPVSVTIQIEFSEPMKRETINNGNIYLATVENLVPGSLTFLPGDTLAIFHPLNDLEPDTDYWIVIKTGATDLAGNSFCDAVNSFFRTAPVPDEECPKINSFSPPSGATSVSSGTNIVVRLNEAIDEESVSEENFYLLYDTEKVFVSISVQNGNVLELNPTENLRWGATYTAVIRGVKDLAGNGLCQALVWSFTIQNQPDNNCPAILSVEPADGSLDVPRNVNILIRFSEWMKTSTLNEETIVLSRGEGEPGVPGVISFQDEGRIAILNPFQDLLPEAIYFVKVTARAIDLAGNALCEEFTSSFITEGVPDTDPPYVTETRPEANEIHVLPQVIVEADFSEPMDISSLNVLTFILKDSSGAGIRGDVDYLGGVTNTVSFTPAEFLTYDTRYEAEITTSVRDRAGNHMITPHVWRFTIQEQPDEVCPAWISFLPPEGAIDVSPEAEIVVVLSEKVLPETVWSETFFLKRGETRVNASISNEGGVIFKLSPAENLLWNTTYTVMLTQGVKDPAGNPLCEELIWAFKTQNEPDNDCPFVTSVIPANSAIEVSLETDVSVHFNEPVSEESISRTTFFLEKPNGQKVSGNFFHEGDVVRFKPTGNLEPNARYTVKITPGVKDPAGNSLCETFVSTFATLTQDVACPSIISFLPEANAVDVSPETNIVVYFDEAIDAGTVTPQTFYLKRGGTGIPGAFSFANEMKRITLNPNADLEAATVYTVTVKNLKDPAGNLLCETRVWSFTTVSEIDTECPEVVSVQPLNNTENVQRNANVRLRFSERMEAASVVSAVSLKKGADGIAVTTTFSDGNTVATLNPNADLEAATTYTVSVLTSAKDEAGNALCREFTSRFTTEEEAVDNTAPVVVSTVPTNGATNIALNQVISATFSEEMAAATINVSTFIVKKETTGITGTVHYSGLTATFTAADPLDYDTLYTAKITTGATDLAGNALLQNYVWSFTTKVWVNPEPVNLASAGNFAVLAGTAVLNSGDTVVNGDLGVSPGDIVTGFPPGQVTGEIHTNDAWSIQARYDLTAAYNDAANRMLNLNIIGDGELGGLNLIPGLYKSGVGSFTLVSETLVLDALGNPDAVWIFQSESLTTSRNVVLAGGARTDNIFWQVSGLVNLGAASVFKGNLLIREGPAILDSQVALHGRILLRNGEVSLNEDTITKP